MNCTNYKIKYTLLKYLIYLDKLLHNHILLLSVEFGTMFSSCNILSIAFNF